MTKHGIAKRDGIYRAESNSILGAVFIEKAVREYLRGKPRTLRLLLEGHCDAIEREDESGGLGAA
jgi:hypothetical protein